MPEPLFDETAPGLAEETDSRTLIAIEQGLAQLDAGESIPLLELRLEFARRSAK